MRSLRVRVLLGAAFWTIGLVILVIALFIVFIEHSSVFRALVEVHALFKQPILLLFAVVSMIVGVVQVRRGVSPLNHLRHRLAGVHQGRAPRVEGSYPPEVQPLVNDLNALLDHREQAVRRAVAKAGDLAHGLKTPLALLAREAERAEAKGDNELAAGIAQHVERMRRQIDYHLAQARAAASGTTPGATCSVKESAEGLARTMARLYAERQLSIEPRVPESHTVRAQREDLDEMLGNLVDNACKWARTRVTIDSVESVHAVSIAVSDDGAGLPMAMREVVLQRGVRADERAPGSGLGLAITRDLAELYHGSIALDTSPLGGLRATLTLPRD